MGCSPSRVDVSVIQNPDAVVQIDRQTRRKTLHRISGPLLPYISGLTTEQCQLISDTFHALVLVQRPDFFHKVWTRAIAKSPKFNEIIALGHYCVRDLSKWPKLNRLSNKVERFLERLIFDYKLDLGQSIEECQQLGSRHLNYSQFGFKALYFDLWCSAFTEMLHTLKIPDDENKAKMDRLTAAYTTLIVFVSTNMVEGYREERRKLSLMNAGIVSLPPNAGQQGM